MKDPNFTGDCLTNQKPTIDEYEDFFYEQQSKTSTTLKGEESQNRTVFFPPKTCPKGYAMDHKGVCRKVNWKFLKFKMLSI